MTSEVVGACDRHFLKQRKPSHDHTAVSLLTRPDNAINTFAHQIDKLVSVADMQRQLRVPCRELSEPGQQQLSKEVSVNVDPQVTSH